MRKGFACLCVIAACVVAVIVGSPASVSAAGPAVSVTLTTSDGANRLTPQPSLAFGPDTSALNNAAMDVNENQTFQQIDGFGASVTDSSGFLIGTKMSSAQRNSLMTSLFDPVRGIG